MKQLMLYFVLFLSFGWYNAYGILDYSSAQQVPLYLACYRGDLQTVKNLIEKEHINPKKFEFALHYACNNNDGNLDVVKYLVETCQCPLSNSHPRPLFYAFKKRNSDIVKYLIPKMKVQITVFDSNTISFKTATEEELQQIEKFILDLIPLDKVRENIESLLIDEKLEELNHFLIDATIKLNDFVENYNKKIQPLLNHPLKKYVQKTRLESLYQEYLQPILCFCPPNDESITELLPLEIACTKNSLRLLKFLIEEQNFGPQLFCDDEKWSFLNVLMYAHHCDKESDCTLLDCITYLIESYHVDLTDRSLPDTLLHQICCSHCSSPYRIIDYLVTHGIPIDSVNENHMTPLDVAVKSDRFEIVKYLVEKYGARPDSKEILFWAPHHNLDLIRYLITHGAKLDVILTESPYGYGNILHCASNRGELELIKILVDEFGMNIDVTIGGKTAQDIARWYTECPYVYRCCHSPTKEVFENSKKVYYEIVEYLKSKKDR